ncbi:MULTISPECIES: conserved phage C-terminal domain-containing protein [unclassified Sporosarcina]|uniref:conserved phage C-terminal domain-containing protein n=1 Tax=unclassified Sporosarcina TaxID=2647733 RepID=UPI0013040029|nr:MULTISPECIES: conserved phage C-terminal domain-containing protein [unclassified Sporosarcina]
MKLLIDEESIPLLPSLVHLVGINGALFMQQVHFRSLVSKNVRDGHRWIHKTYKEWTKEFTFWSSNTIRRIIYDLENKGYLISTDHHNRMKIDNTKWYRIDYTRLPESAFEHEQVTCSEPPRAPVGVEQVHMAELGKPITKELKESLKIKNKDQVEMNLDVAHVVINYLNDKAGKQFKAQSLATRKFIAGRVKEGYTQEDFMKVIDLKVSQWINHAEFNRFLRPSTLFSATNFENYINELAVVQKPKKRLLALPVLDFNKGDEHL